MHGWLHGLAVCGSGTYKTRYHNNLIQGMKTSLWKTAGGCGSEFDQDTVTDFAKTVLKPSDTLGSCPRAH